MQFDSSRYVQITLKKLDKDIITSNIITKCGHVDHVHLHLTIPREIFAETIFVVDTFIIIGIKLEVEGVCNAEYGIRTNLESDRDDEVLFFTMDKRTLSREILYMRVRKSMV